MVMQALPWGQRMRKEEAFHQEEEEEEKKNCVRSHNRTCTRPHPLHLLLLLPMQGEEKASPVVPRLDPNT